MKLHSVLVVVAVLLSCLAAVAFGKTTGHVEKGFRLGIDLSTLRGDDARLPVPWQGSYNNGASTASPAKRTGFAAAAYLFYAFNPKAGLESELWYVTKGAKYSGSDAVEIDLNSTTGNVRYQASGWTATRRINYIESPLLLRITPHAGSSVNPYLIGGPALAFNLGGKLTTETTTPFVPDPSLRVSTEEDLWADINRLEVGAVVGAGLQIPAGSSRMSLEGRYTWGLSSVDGSSQGADMKNGTLVLSAGLGF